MSSYSFDYIDVHGDSQLIIDFMNQHAKVSDSELYRLVSSIRTLVRNNALKVQYSHSLREYNEHADQLGRLALQYGRMVTLSDLQLPEACTATDVCNSTSNPCKYCGRDAPSDLVCDYCGKAVCLACAGVSQPPDGFFYCFQCRNESGDITLDHHLMHYVFTREHSSSDIIDQLRIEQADKWLRVSNDVLMCRGKSDTWRVIPPISERTSILRDYHSYGHLNAEKTYGCVRRDYYWYGMRQQCFDVVAACEGCQKERAIAHPYAQLTPLDKCAGPFQGWAIDLITDLSPPGPNDEVHCIVAVDVFSKYVEIQPIKDRTSQTVGNWLYNEIIARYGKPRVIRTDGGPEFEKVFEEQCKLFGIQHRVSSARYPQSNGQVERFNRSIKTAFRKFIGECRASTWFDWLPEIKIGLRMSLARSHGYSPFFLTFKQEPVHPAYSFMGEIVSLDLSELDEQQLADSILSIWTGLRDQAIRQLRSTDERMQQYYSLRKRLSDNNVQFIFSPGEKVLVVMPRQGKLLPRSVGPYVFVRYNNQSQFTATLKMPNGKTIRRNVTHLVPYYELSSDSQ